MIAIRNFHKRFNHGTLNEVYALHGVTLDVAQGEFVTIIGTNGSGKSTLLNAIAGTFLPDEGTIAVGDRDVTHQPEHRRARFISRVFQNPFSGTAPGMTIAENLHMAFLRGRHRMPAIRLTASQRSSFREQISLLEMQLEDRLDNTIGSLSGGQRQAITLLMAVLTKPKILLLDEHTAALDPKSAAQIVKLTQRFIERDGLTAVMVTHSMQQALDLGTRTLMMNKGEIIDDMSAEDKRRSTIDDLLDRFAELRKNEMLTPEMIEELRRGYN